MQLKAVKTIVRVVVFNAEGKVLLMQRSATDDKGASEWEVPGGEVDPGEDFAASANRELMEETGLSVTPVALKLVHTYSGDFGNGQRCLLFFVANIDTEPMVSLSHEHDNYKWVSLEESINQSLFQRHEQALKYIQQNILA